MRLQYDNLEDDVAERAVQLFITNIPTMLAELRDQIKSPIHDWKIDYSRDSVIHAVVLISDYIQVELHKDPVPIGWRKFMNMYYAEDKVRALQSSSVLYGPENANLPKWRLTQRSREHLTRWGVYLGECIRARYPGCEWMRQTRTYTKRKYGHVLKYKDMDNNQPILFFATKGSLRPGWAPCTAAENCMKKSIEFRNLEQQFTSMVNANFETASEFVHARNDSRVFIPSINDK